MGCLMRKLVFGHMRTANTQISLGIPSLSANRINGYYRMKAPDNTLRMHRIIFVCVEILRLNQPNGVMSSAVTLPYRTFTGQA